MSFLDAGLTVLGFLVSPGAVLFYGLVIFVVILAYGAYRSDMSSTNSVAFWVFYWVALAGYVFFWVTLTVWISNGGGW